MRKLNGRDVRITHGLAETLAQLEREPPEFHVEVARFVDGLVSHFVEGEPLYRVHECVFGVLALESEPVDPRL